MLLRIFLILSILAGIGTIAITQFKVRPHIQGIIEFRDKETRRADVAESSLKKTRTQLSETENELRDTKKDLENTQSQLTSTKNELENATTRANDLQKDLDNKQSELLAKGRELSAWEALLIPVEQVKAVMESEKKLIADIEALTEEKKIINEELTRAQAKIKTYEQGRGEDFDVPMVPGIRGRVLVVDPKWKFVVINLGRQDNVEENGVLMVSRNGKLVAKVKIKRVQETRCIANVMPGWSFDEILEGDFVLN